MPTRNQSKRLSKENLAEAEASQQSDSSQKPPQRILRRHDVHRSPEGSDSESDKDKETGSEPYSPSDLSDADEELHYNGYKLAAAKYKAKCLTLFYP